MLSTVGASGKPGTGHYPGPAGAATAGRRDFARRAANSFHHPVGTCRLGAVVDGALRVEGIAGLRGRCVGVAGHPADDGECRHDCWGRESERLGPNGLKACARGAWRARVLTRVLRPECG
ncbi:GMC oxidoreductase [Dankookia sp. GCM10030260]|uniref:GMC oxidoreductase n=1 Tax=Dankookia sp. GCM10030260 TaxID=3273390 RepID=UPI0036091E7E